MYFSPWYPKDNGLAESTNKIVINTIKRQLGKYKSKWVEEPPGALCSYRTMHKTTTGEAPFSLVYCTKTMLPVETSLRSVRMEFAAKPDNSKSLEVDLKLLEERREYVQAMEN